MTACVLHQYSIECKGDRYDAYRAWAGAMGAVYAVGVPLLFHFLVRRFKDCGKSGDAVVDSALGWMYQPYRSGREKWLIVEMFRILLLTSCVGFMSRSCYVKMLLTQLLSLAFLAYFLYTRPYRRAFHNLAQGLTMCVPIFGPV